MTRILTAFFGAIFIITAPMAARAEVLLTSQDVERFLSVAEGLKGFDEKYPDVDMELDFDGPDAFGKLLDDNGNLSLFKQIDARLPAGPARNDFMGVIKSNGFSSNSNFASVADAIVMAFIALEMEGEDLSQLDAMTPAMMAQMPPQVRQQLESVKLLVTAAKNVPAGNIDAVRAYRSKFDEAFNN